MVKKSHGNMMVGHTKLSRLVSLSFFVLSANACNANSFAIEDEFTDREVELIHKAIDEWIEATDSDGAVIFTREGYSAGHKFDYFKDWLGGPEYPVLHKMRSNDPGYNPLKISVGYDYAGAARERWRIAIVEDYIDSEDEFYHVILHEIGHFYGIEHQADGLMARSSYHTCIDVVALGAFCDIYSCGRNRHVTCE